MGPDKQFCVDFTFNLTIPEKKNYRKVCNIFFEDGLRKADDNLLRYKL